MKKVIVAFGLCICLLSVKGQDSLSLKSGEIIAGEILSFGDNKVTIIIESDTLDYRLDEIKSLRYSGPVAARNIQPSVRTEAVRMERENRRKGIGPNPVKIDQ